MADAAPRAIRRDVPLTNSIRRAYEAGTRDMTGRPGPNYWQLQTDYTINARLDPATQTITGHRDDHAAQQQPAGADRDRAAARSQHLPRPRAARRRRCRRRTPTAWSSRASPSTARPSIWPRRRRRRRPRPRRQRAAEAVSVSGLDQTLARIALATPIAGEVDREARDRLAHEAARRTRRARPPHDAALGRHALPADAVVPARREVRRPARLGHEPLPRARRSSTTTSAGSTCSIDVPGGWIVSGTGVLQNPQEVLTAKARERLTHVLESDDVDHDRRRRRSRPRPGDRRRRSAGLALRRRHGERLRVGDGEELRLARDARDDSRQGPDPDPHGATCRSARSCSPTPARSRATRSSSTRSCGRRIRSRS